ncbi:hypothetical protein cypCar_00032592 [Cyprinus carpio]|nr:hypothetical protein cypCar_00032592 [Cyprinus carpio]
MFIAGWTGTNERTFIAVKPDGVQRRLVWQGLDVVKTARKMLGETNPADSLPGTIRGDYCIEVGRNVIHGSDSVESAQREISLWFEHHELFCWEECNEHWIYA